MLTGIKIATVLLLFFAYTVYSDALTPKQALKDLAENQAKIETASALNEHYSVLISLLQPSTWATTPANLEEKVAEFQTTHNSLNQQIISSGSRAHTLIERVNNITEETCNPCLASNIRHFSRSVDFLSEEVTEAVEELYSVAKESAAAFSSAFLTYSQELLSNDTENISSQALESSRSMLQKAEELYQSNEHLRTIETCIELFELVIK
ncbi:hypothetical protein QA601_12480 [Chitinispirillales bacterium ANBcel5]|uniref:hypothetical protein n=1 Tax=Cellulosispirillum alkaliphilum TaxID=3039283 RepID=UPI002A535953|nr:hypothetical protein [Chitinispirillales bacterium ANBcel5]